MMLLWSLGLLSCDSAPQSGLEALADTRAGRLCKLALASILRDAEEIRTFSHLDRGDKEIVFRMTFIMEGRDFEDKVVCRTTPEPVLYMDNSRFNRDALKSKIGRDYWASVGLEPSD